VSVPSKVRELTEEICAFANAAGGILLIGVDDANKLKGIKIDNVKRSAIQNSISEVSPQLNCSFEVVNVDGFDIAVIEVPIGINKPYVCSGSIYVRVGPNSQKLKTAEQMRDFFQESEKLYFDEATCKDFDVESQIDRDNFFNFRVEAGFSPAVTDSQIRKNLQLFTSEGYFKRGGVLFFGSQPELFYEQAITRCVAFRGVNKRYISDDKTYTGPLFVQYTNAREWLRGKLNVGYDIEGQGGGPRKEVWEIPETVFKEAIVNALSHRDYYEKGAVTTIELFDDRVEISNPGGLLASVGKEFGHKSVSRNPLIFSLFQRMHLVEKVGSGILRMEEMMIANHLPAPIYQKEGLFTITFKRPVLVEVEIKEKHENSVVVTVEETVEETILKLIQQKSSITTKELANETKLSIRGVEYQLNKLKSEGKIQRSGFKKGGHWVIVFERKDKKTVEETVEETVVKTVEETILKLIQQKSSITTNELANETKLSRRGVEYQLNKLKSEGKIQRSGSTKGGHWVIVR
jgi:ATP-dependent DNA helicase RecG